MFGGATTSFSSPAGAGFPSSSQQYSHSVTAMGSGIVSPNSSGFGLGLGSSMSIVGGGSPIFQSPAGSKFPAGGGPIVFTPHSHAGSPGGGATATVMSPYSYVGGSASSFVQSPPPSMMAGGGGGVYASPVYSSTMINSPHHHHHHHHVPVGGSPVTHGYGPPVQYSNAHQAYGYGTRVMSAGGYAYQHSPYQQQQHHTSPHHYGHGHHSPRDEYVEPMHCSPNAQVQTVGGPQYQQLHRNPNSPPRPQYMPAFLTGVDAVAAVQPRPRRMFERSPSTSPPAVGSRSPQSKSPNWTQQEGTQSASGAEGIIAGGGGMYNRRVVGQGPNRQLRFADSQNQTLQTTQAGAGEEKEKKRSGPPIRGFGSSEDVANFLSSPLLQEGNNIVPGSAIAQEAISKAGTNTAIAESNWITVFGFPPAAASFIFTHFSQYGSIIQSKCNPGGNWLHVQYASRIDARKALACNGKVLGGTIMVGVISSPKEVIEMYGKPQQEAQSNTETISSVNNSTRSQQPSTMKSPLQERNSSDAFTSSTDPSKPRGIRPLAGTSQLTSPVLGGDRSFVIQRENRNALSPGGNENMPLPTASTGILTKAMEYMFGW